MIIHLVMHELVALPPTGCWYLYVKLTKSLFMKFAKNEEDREERKGGVQRKDMGWSGFGELVCP